MFSHSLAFTHAISFHWNVKLSFSFLSLLHDDILANFQVSVEIVTTSWILP